jgi:hypothetical protein
LPFKRPSIKRRQLSAKVAIELILRDRRKVFGLRRRFEDDFSGPSAAI